MRILGIDPSIRSTGYAFLEVQGPKTTALAYGCIPNPVSRSPEASLHHIYQKLTELLAEHQPESCAIEKIIYVQSSRTAIIMGSARGAALVAVAGAGLSITEYPAKLIKKAATGHGSAQKSQVAFMMRALLGLRETPPSDAADALAIAMTHARCLASLQRQNPEPPRVKAAFVFTAWAFNFNFLK
ncbi:MAG: crossover junction endodeoxyribonuclease RuvC [Blastochloris sp.]|nr:crossover junction endodeoxyribonuclease RuvC [Blastochloris sp.]